MSDDEMTQLLDAVERRLGSTWTDTVEFLREQNKLDDVAARIEAGDIDGAIQGVEHAADKLAAEAGAAYYTAGQSAADWLDGKTTDSLIRFDQTNDRALAWAKRNRYDLVRGLTTEQRELTRQVISDGVASGDNPRAVARTLRATIGLTPAQEKVVANYRTALENGDWSNALGRELRDGRMDRTLQRLQRDDGKLTQPQIDRAVGFYRDSLHSLRAETVARTEGLRAVHQGTEELFRQAIDNGDIEHDDITRQWNHAGRGKHSRQSHVAMNRQRQKIGDPFQTPSGVMIMFPGDPAAPPEETINCRCVLSTRFA